LPIPGESISRRRSGRGPQRAQEIHAETHRHPLDPDHRRGAHRHRPGLRVRLLRRAGLQGAAEEGYRVILVNSNPATIMTDPGMADATYIEPITPEIVAKIIEAERPDALLPTMGGQTGAQHRARARRHGRARPSTGSS
jgi:hypothetical protein